MTHYCAYVLIPAQGDPAALVAEVLAPFDEYREVEWVAESDGEGGYWENPAALWDAWQIGGRFSGSLSGYDPGADPGLVERCPFCDGTGRRDDDIGRAARDRDPNHTCNGCHGTGTRRLSPTRWPDHVGDVGDAADVVADLPRLPFTFLVHGGEAVYQREVHRPDPPGGPRFVEVADDDALRRLIRTTVEARATAGSTGDRIVVVDYHH